MARAIRSTFTGRVAVTYVEWAGDDMQEVVVPWTVLDGDASAKAFAAATRRGALPAGDVDLDQRGDRLLRTAFRR